MSVRSARIYIVIIGYPGGSITAAVTAIKAAVQDKRVGKCMNLQSVQRFGTTTNSFEFSTMFFFAESMTSSSKACIAFTLHIIGAIRRCEFDLER
jgi:hypothetical protein